MSRKQLSANGERAATTTAKSAPSSSVPESSAETASRDTPVFSGGHKGETTEKTAAEKERLKKQAIDALISSGVTNLGGYPFSPRPIEAGELADLNVTAALILQPELVPEPLRQSDLGEGGLMLRLPEVARLPTQKYIVALVTLEQADGTMMDGMLLHLPIGNLRYLQKSEVVISNQDAEASALTEPVAAPLTLRQLLGNEADQFRLIEMQPTAAAGQE